MEKFWSVIETFKDEIIKSLKEIWNNPIVQVVLSWCALFISTSILIKNSLYMFWIVIVFITFVIPIMVKTSSTKSEKCIAYVLIGGYILTYVIDSWGQFSTLVKEGKILFINHLDKYALPDCVIYIILILISMGIFYLSTSTFITYISNLKQICKSH